MGPGLLARPRPSEPSGSLVSLRLITGTAESVGGSAGGATRAGRQIRADILGMLGGLVD